MHKTPVKGRMLLQIHKKHSSDTDVLNCYNPQAKKLIQPSEFDDILSSSKSKSPRKHKEIRVRSIKSKQSRLSFKSSVDNSFSSDEDTTKPNQKNLLKDKNQLKQDKLISKYMKHVKDVNRKVTETKLEQLSLKTQENTNLDFSKDASEVDLQKINKRKLLSHQKMPKLSQLTAMGSPENLYYKVDEHPKTDQKDIVQKNGELTIIDSERGNAKSPKQPISAYQKFNSNNQSDGKNWKLRIKKPKLKINPKSGLKASQSLSILQNTNIGDKTNDNTYQFPQTEQQPIEISANWKQIDLSVSAQNKKAEFEKFQKDREYFARLEKGKLKNIHNGYYSKSTSQLEAQNKVTLNEIVKQREKTTFKEEFHNMVIMEEKLRNAKKLKEQRIKMGLIKPRELQPGEILSKNGHVIRPEKKLDKKAYNDMIQEQEEASKKELRELHEQKKLMAEFRYFYRGYGIEPEDKKEQQRRIDHNAKMKLGDIEKELVRKYQALGPQTSETKNKEKLRKKMMAMKNSASIDNIYETDAQYQGKYLKRRALVDQMMVDNSKQLVSHAESKKQWIGEEGKFASEDLQAWFKVYDQTNILKNKQLPKDCMKKKGLL